MRAHTAIVMVAIFTATLLVACGEDDRDATPTVAPTTATAGMTPTSSPQPMSPTSSPTATAIVSDAEQLRRTGEAQLDRIIEAVEARDVATLDELIEYQLIGCTFAGGSGGPPKCETGQREGEVVPVFLASSCEGEWARSATQHLGTFAHEADGLWAVLAVAEYPSSDLFPKPDWLLVFHDVRDGMDMARYLLVTNGRIAGTAIVCFGPLSDLLNNHAFALKVVAGPWDEPLASEPPEAPQTGIAPLDDLLTAVANYDLLVIVEGAQEAMADLPGVPCNETLLDPGGVECDAQKGEQPGDVISVFPQAYCEGALARSPLQAIAGFLDGVPRLRAIVEPPPEPSRSELYPHGSYWVVYELVGLDVPRPIGARLQVTEDGNVTVIWYGCGSTPNDLARWEGEALPEIAVNEP